MPVVSYLSEPLSVDEVPGDPVTSTGVRRRRAVNLGTLGEDVPVVSKSHILGVGPAADVHDDVASAMSPLRMITPAERGSGIAAGLVVGRRGHGAFRFSQVHGSAARTLRVQCGAR